MGRYQTALAVGVLAAGVAVAGCDIRAGENGGFSVGVVTGKAEDTWTRTYPLSPGDRLEIVNTNGRIDAEPSSGTSVEVIATRSVKATSDEKAKDLLAAIEMREDTAAGRVRIEARMTGLRVMASQEVRWAVKVPKGVHVDLRNVNGRIRITGLDGEVHAETTNGGVDAERLAARVIEASSVNGGVRIAIATPLGADGRVEIETVNGGASLELPTDSKATITATTVNGSVRVSDLDLQRQGEDTRRRVEGTLNGGGARVSVSTTNGGVRLSGAGRRPTS